MTEKHPPALDTITIGLISISDRASQGVYRDQGIPAMRQWLEQALRNPVLWQEQVIADEQGLISQALITLQEAGCNLILTTGGTGPALRDVTPEATLAIADKELPGFGEQMRQISLHFVPTAILSRQVAVTRQGCLIINLPGQPKAITQILQGVAQEGLPRVSGIFAAVPYCVDLLGGPYIETHPQICEAFRPASAKRLHY